MATTALGLIYPASTGHTRLWEHLQDLATSADTAITTATAPKPLCKLVLNANFSIANNSNTVTISFGSGSEAVKTVAGMHSTSVNTSRITPTVAGYYEFSGAVSLAGNTTGFRTHSIGKNGVRQAPEGGVYTSSGLPAGPTVLVLPQITTILAMNGTTDYAELFCYQNSGGALNAIGDGNPATTNNTTFTCKYLEPL